MQQKISKFVVIGFHIDSTYKITLLFFWFLLFRAVNVTVKVQKQDGETVTYEYKKPLPEDIVPDRCSQKVTINFSTLVFSQK